MFIETFVLPIYPGTRSRNLKIYNLILITRSVYVTINRQILRVYK